MPYKWPIQGSIAARRLNVLRIFACLYLLNFLLLNGLGIDISVPPTFVSPDGSWPNQCAGLEDGCKEQGDCQSIDISLRPGNSVCL
jgi:hypothetical protein